MWAFLLDKYIFKLILCEVELFHILLPYIQCLSKGYKNEVLRLASVSTAVWNEYLQVFNMFENGELKGQTLSKKQLLTKPEIKSTQFQCLFPLDEATQITLLQQLQSKAIGMKEMHLMAQKHKRMADLKAKFCHLTNVSDWKEATQKFPGTGVPPLVVFCNQVTRAKYDPKLKDAYMYEVAGGLHSYTAKKELAEEYPHNPFYKKVEAVVYAGLSDEQALRLALRHNVNGHFVHKMTFRDLVSSHDHITLLVEHSML